MRIRQQLYSTMIGWSHLAFIVPIAIAVWYQILWHGLLLSLAVIVSLIFHSRPEGVWRKIDPLFACALITGNLYLCYLSSFKMPYFEVALLFVFIAFYFYFKGKKDNYILNHSLWHLTSVVITTCCLLGYIAR